MQEDMSSLLCEAKKRFLDYTPHAKQLLFHNAGKIAKERLFKAGNRTGKTYSGVIEACMHLTGRYPAFWEGKTFSHEVNGWCSSVSHETNTNTLLPMYLSALGSSVVSHNKTNNRVIVKHISGKESEITFKSYEQGRTKFQAARLDFIHLDEEPSRDIYMECLMRIISVKGRDPAIMFTTMTPLKGTTDTILRFKSDENVEDAQNNFVSPETHLNGRYYVQASWEDNPHLVESEKKELYNSMRPHERKMRVYGEDTVGVGLVYPIAEETYVIEPREIPEYWNRVYAIDFGWRNPTAFLTAAYDRDNNVLYITSEYYVSECTPQQHALELTRRNLHETPGVYDPAGLSSSQADGVSLVSLYNKAGITNLTKADNNVHTGITEVLQWFQNGKLKIFNTLHHFRNEIRQYSTDEKGRIIKQNDHLLDCLRYIVMTGVNVSRPITPKRIAVGGYGQERYRPTDNWITH